MRRVKPQFHEGRTVGGSTYSFDSFLGDAAMLDYVVDQAIHTQKFMRASFDTLVGTGISGSIVVPILANALDCNWVIVRKEGTSNHSYSAVEGRLGSHWVIVDDFVGTGATERKVYETVQAVTSGWNPRPEFVGTFVYKDQRFYKLGRKVILGA